MTCVQWFTLHQTASKQAVMWNKYFEIDVAVGEICSSFVSMGDLPFWLKRFSHKKVPWRKKKRGGGLYSVTETKITAGKNSFNKHIAGRNTAWNRTGDIQEMWLGSALLYAGDVSHCGGVWSPPVQTPGEIPQCRIRLVRPMPGLILICQRN